MSDNIGDKQRIEPIYEAISHIENFVQGIYYEAYRRNFQRRLAPVKLLEISGEASAMLSDELKTNFSQVEWRTLKAVRNRLVHEYFGINYEVIRASIQQDIPPLKQKTEVIRTDCDIHPSLQLPRYITIQLTGRTLSLIAGYCQTD